VIGPQKNTCYEYKKMKGFVSIEMINGSLAVQRPPDKQSFVGAG